MNPEFFSLEPTHDPHRWSLPITPEISAGPSDRPFLFGGVGLGAALTAAERTLGRPAIWATAQFISFAQLGSVIDFEVRAINVGNSLTQARVIAHTHDREILFLTAALGQRQEPNDQWLLPDPAPSPADCPRVLHWRENHNALGNRLEKRLIEGRYPNGDPIAGRGNSGRLRLWVRSTEKIPTSAAFLAVVADFAIQAASTAIGRYVGGNSLDNTIRFGPIVPGEWLLCDIKIESIHSGIIHSTMKIFHQQGILMATASQSLILRYQSPAREM